MREDPTIGVEEPALDDAALEALAEAYAAAPPTGLRERLLRAARDAGAARRAQRVARRWRLIGSAAAALAVVCAGWLAGTARLAARRGGELTALGRANAELAARVDEQGRMLAGLRDAAAAQTHVLRILGAPDTRAVMLAPRAEGGGSGRVLFDVRSGEAALVVAGLGPAGEGKVYELWAIRGKRTPEPAGLFSVGAEAAMVTHIERLERPTEVTAFAVSIEPAGGSRVPTGPIVLIGTSSG